MRVRFSGISIFGVTEPSVSFSIISKSIEIFNSEGEIFVNKSTPPLKDKVRFGGISKTSLF